MLLLLFVAASHLEFCPLDANTCFSLHEQAQWAVTYTNMYHK
jgi:hypothetical protein